jgi:hypothetical protein
MQIQIGSQNWRKDLINFTSHLGNGFWDRFTPVSEQRLKLLELEIGRRLPDDFREFYRLVGYGDFEPGSGFYSPDDPDDIVACLGAPIYFVLGSATPGEEWATEEQHRFLWTTRGNENPNPHAFTEEALTLNGVKLYDLLQFGSNGSGCYHQLYIGPDPIPFRYCLLTDSGTIENVALSFSEALRDIIGEYFSNLIP